MRGKLRSDAVTAGMLLLFIAAVGAGYYSLSAVDHWQFVIEGYFAPAAPSAAVLAHAHKMQTLWLVVFAIDGVVGLAALAVVIINGINRVRRKR